jgi:CBS domain-containing protein
MQWVSEVVGHSDDRMNRRRRARPCLSTYRVRSSCGCGAAGTLVGSVADGARCLGALTPADVAADLAADLPVAAIARPGRTLAPDATATSGRDAVLEADGRRVPVVDDDGRLVGVLAITTDARHFACRDR